MSNNVMHILRKQPKRSLKYSVLLYGKDYLKVVVHKCKDWYMYSCGRHTLTSVFASVLVCNTNSACIVTVGVQSDCNNSPDSFPTTFSVM